MTLEEALLSVEQEAEDAGWDSALSGPMIFEIHVGATGFYAHFDPSINEHIARDCGKDTGEFFTGLGEAAVTVRALYDSRGEATPMDDDFIGLGVRAEAWDYYMFGREESRFVSFFHRNGERWYVHRVRGGEATVEDVTGKAVAGGIPHGVSTMLNAMVPEEVPIAPISLETDDE